MQHLKETSTNIPHEFASLSLPLSLTFSVFGNNEQKDFALEHLEKRKTHKMTLS